MGCGSAHGPSTKYGQTEGSDMATSKKIAFDELAEGPVGTRDSEPLNFTSSLRSGISCITTASIEEGDELNVIVACQEDVFREVGNDDLCLFGVTNKIDDGSPIIEAEFDEKDYVFSGMSSKQALLERLASWPAGVACRKARKPEQPNQDNLFICESNGLTAIGIADGHGDHGHWASHFVVQFILHLLFRDILPEGEIPTDAEMYKLFDTAHQALAIRFLELGMSLDHSGTTLSICIIEHCTNTVLTAWVGDSRCVHCTPVGTESLTVDHKPQDLPEMTRILASGGRIVAGRVVTGGDTTLAMSRSIGDVVFQKVGVSHRPMIKRTRLVDNQDTPLAKQFILCCSDGIWEFISDTEAADIMRSYLPERATEGVEALVGESRKRWLERTPRTDDISCIALMIGCATV